jgi:hypothetical protein
MLNIKLEERTTVDQIIKFIPLEITQTVRRFQAKRQLKNSMICKTNKEKMFLLNTLGGKLFETTLLYQTDKLDKKEFHRLCDNKGPTITLAQLEHNDHCVGGFRNAHWTSPDKSVYVEDS